MRVWTDCAVCGVGTKAEAEDLEPLCPPCLDSELGEARELALEAMRQPVQVAGYTPRRRFGSGPAEIPSRAITQALARPTPPRVLEGVLIVATVAAVTVAIAAELWLRVAFR